MPHTMSQIARLYAAASDEERTELASILDYDLADLGRDAGDADIVGLTLAKQLWWKFQSPIGYLLNRPTFDDIAIDIARRMKLEGLVSPEISCWQLLEKVIRNLTEQMLDEMTAEQKEEFVKKFLTEKEYEKFAQHKPSDFTKLGGGALFLLLRQFGRAAAYRFALITANQIARVLLGRGLAMAANVALTRTISLILGPVGWLLFVWGINDLMGTNYKRVIPAAVFTYSIYERLKDQDALPFE